MDASSSWRQIYNSIMCLPSVSPSDPVNQAVSSLLKKVSQSEQDDLEKSDLTEQEILQLRQRFSESVCELEKHWAHKILDDPNHQLALRRFPQWDNYVKVVQREWKTIQIYADSLPHGKTLLIGGGSIPLTAIILAQEYNVSSVVLDNDAESIDLAGKIIVALGLQGQITLIHSSGQRFKGYQDYSLIFVAALAGINSSVKQRIFAAIKTQSGPNTYILNRSSYGARKILYVPLDQSIQQQFQTVIEIHPDDEVMNSTILLKTVGKQHKQ